MEHDTLFGTWQSSKSIRQMIGLVIWLVILWYWSYEWSCGRIFIEWMIWWTYDHAWLCYRHIIWIRVFLSDVLVIFLVIWQKLVISLVIHNRIIYFSYGGYTPKIGYILVIWSWSYNIYDKLYECGGAPDALWKFWKNMKC